MSDVDQVRIERINDRVYILLSGRLTLWVTSIANTPHKVPGTPDSSYTLIEIIRVFPDVAFDLSGVTEITDTWGGIIRELNKAHQKKHNTPLRVSKQSDAVEKYFAISGLNNIWPAGDWP